MRKYPVWLDCDVGVDDAVAIMVAHGMEEIDLLGISAVCGNTTLENVMRNAHCMNRLMGANYPIHRGADKPLFKTHEPSTMFHGENGMGDVDLPLPEVVPEQELPAWDAMYQAARKYPGELRIIAIGPMTNLGICIGKYPDFAELVHSILIMGGSTCIGNASPAAEFNIWDDPEAAAQVFDCGVPVVMCGLDVTLKAVLTPAEWDELAETGTEAGKLVGQILAKPWSVLQQMGFPGVPMHDSCPVVYLVHPELFKAERGGVKVETRGTITNGKTVTDLFSDKQFEDQHVDVVLDVDREKFIQVVMDCIKKI